MILLLSIFISTAVYITYDLLNMQLWFSYAILSSMIILFYPIVIVKQFSILKIIRNAIIIAILYLLTASVFYIIFPFGLRSDLPSLLVEDNIYIYVFLTSFIFLFYAKTQNNMKKSKNKIVLDFNMYTWIIIVVVTVTNIYKSNYKLKANNLEVQNNLKYDFKIDKLKSDLLKSKNWRVARIKESIFSDVLISTMREPKTNTRIFNNAGFLGTFHDRMLMIKIPYCDPLKRLCSKDYEVSNNFLTDSVFNINFFYTGRNDPYAGYTKRICHLNLIGDTFGVELYATDTNAINLLLDQVALLLNKDYNLDSFESTDLDSLTKMDYRSFSRNEHGYFRLYGFSGDLQTIKNGEFVPSYGKMIQGYINEGKGGRLYVKVHDIDRNSMISKRSVLAETKVSCLYPEEYVGWSENENEMFYFEIPFEYKNGYQKFLEKFELWFDPDSYEEDYLIYEKTYENKLILNSEKLVLE